VPPSYVKPATDDGRTGKSHVSSSSGFHKVDIQVIPSTRWITGLAN